MSIFAKTRVRLLTGSFFMIGAITAGMSSVVAAEDEIIVLGTRLEGVAPVAITIKDADDLERRNLPSVADALRTIPGVEVIQPGGAGRAEVFLRGAESNFTQVLVDNVPVENLSGSRGGGYDYATLIPGSIERIEVVTGPVSAVYGSNALAGAINIITIPEVPQRELRVAAGNGGQQQVLARLGGAVGNGWAWHGSVGTAAVDELVDDISADMSSASIALRRYEGAWRGGVQYRYSEGEQKGYPDASGGPEFAAMSVREETQTKEQSFAGDVSVNVAGPVEATVRLTAFQREEEYDIDAVPDGVSAGTPASTGQSIYEAVTVTAFARYRTERVEALGGLEVSDRNGENRGAFDFGFPVPTDFDFDRKTTGIFAEGSVNPGGGLTAYIGVRHDMVDQGPEETSLRGAIGWQPVEQAEARLSYAEGFKLPGFYALADPLVGNPSLDAETAKSWMLDGRWQPETGDGVDVTVTASLFSADYSGLIDFDFATFSLVNRDSVEMTGGEVAVATSFENVDLDAFVSIVDIDTGGAPLRLRADWNAGGSIAWRPRTTTRLSASLTATGERLASAIPTGDVTLEDYARVDLTAEQDLSPELTLFTSLNNVTQADYNEDAGIPAPGLHGLIGVRGTF